VKARMVQRMAMADVVSWQPTGGPTAQVRQVLPGS